jgi:biopolymer transport protein ExbB
MLFLGHPLLLCLVTGTAARAAQDPQSGDNAAGAINPVLDAFENAGVIGWLIVLMSIVALALIIEDFATIKRERMAPSTLLDALETMFDDGDFQAAIEVCERERNYLANVVGAGLSRLGHPFDTIQTAIREMQVREQVKIFQKLGWLALLQTTSPMMGLFGTVLGMFVTFGKIASVGGSVSPAVLAYGIKMALVTTIFGLSVAIPVGTFYFLLRGRALQAITEVNAIAEDLFERFRKPG